MKKNYLFKTLLLLIPITAITLFSFSAGVGGARTGSPGDGGTTCTICHAPGADFGASAMITTNIPSSGYDVDTDYSITITASSSAPGHGFLMTAERLSDNARIGEFLTGGSTDVVVQDGGSRISHANRNNSSWTVIWRSPSTLQGQVRFYASVNAVNNNNSNGGDQTVTAVSEPLNALSISEAKLLRFEMFPNPSPNDINIQLPFGTSKAEAQIFDFSGRLILRQSITSNNNKINVRNLTNGMYLVKVSADGKLGAKRFVKN